MYFKKEFSEKLFRLGFLFVCILVLLDLLTYFFLPNTSLNQVFLATREQTPLTWVSSISIFFIAVVCATQYFKERKLIWYLLTAIFLFLSIDDAVYMHERLSGTLQELVPIFSSFPSYSWIIIYMPVLLTGFILYYLKLNEVSDAKDRKLLLVSAILLFLALILDMLDGWVIKDKTLVFCLDPICNATTTHLIRLIEEVIEVIGLGILAKVGIEKKLTII